MASRALGAFLALAAAAAFVVSIATSAWWAGAPVVDGKAIEAKYVHSGPLGATGCNVGGDGSCEPITVESTVQLVGYAALAAIAVAVLFLFILLSAAYRISEHRKGLATASLLCTLIAAGASGALLALGPAIKASQQVVVPIGWGTYLFGGGVLASLLASLFTRNLEPEPLRLKPSQQPQPQPVPQPQPAYDVREALRQQQQDILRPSTPEMRGTPGPQLRPLYDPQNQGYVPPPQAPQLPMAPTPMNRDAIGQLMGRTPPPALVQPASPAMSSSPRLQAPSEPPPLRPASPIPTESSLPSMPPTRTKPPSQGGLPGMPPMRTKAPSVDPLARTAPPTSPPPVNPLARTAPPSKPPPVNPLARTAPPTSPPPVKARSTPNPDAIPSVPRARNSSTADPDDWDVPSDAKGKGPSTPNPDGSGAARVKAASIAPASKSGPMSPMRVTAPTTPPPPRKPTVAAAVPPPPRDNDPKNEPKTDVEIDHAAKAAAAAKGTKRADTDMRTGKNPVTEPTDVGMTAAPESADDHDSDKVESAITPPTRNDVGDSTAQTLMAPEPKRQNADDLLKAIGGKAEAPVGRKSETPIPTLGRAPNTPIPTMEAQPARQATQIPISTAPTTLPPPKELESAQSGPQPACPQCEAPMSWVDEHLRFYCRQCRMYF